MKNDKVLIIIFTVLLVYFIHCFNYALHHSTLLN
jgi:hypothetical protein